MTSQLGLYTLYVLRLIHDYNAMNSSHIHKKEWEG